VKDGGIIIPESAVQRQTLHFKPSTDLVILGKGDSWPDGQKIARDMDCECWGVNDCDMIPEMTMLFDLHGWDERVQKYNARLRTLHIPVMMKEIYPDVPTSVRFPMEGLVKEFGTTYYNNQLCQMLAFAIQTKRFKRIFLFGVDYCAVDRVEQEFERPCTEFWMGFAMARGISIYISQKSNLLTYTGYIKGVVYCYTENYQSPMEKFREAQPHYWSEYLLGHYGGCHIGKELYDHDEWYDELGKFCTKYVYDKMVQKQKLQEEGAAVTAHKPKRKRKKNAEAENKQAGA
jgi:hypothetical protein